MRIDLPHPSFVLPGASAGHDPLRCEGAEAFGELLARAEQLNPKLSAFLAMNTDDAIDAARTAEQVWMGSGEKPLLCGVPISMQWSRKLTNS
mgnify:CR=1 FL=1